MKPVVYDSGVLIAADRNERRVWAEHRVRLEAKMVPVVSSLVVARVSRSPRQASLRRLLRGCEIAPFGETAAHRTGALLGKARTRDVRDAAVVELAVRREADIVRDDVEDIRRLVAAAGARSVGIVEI